ncbi:glycine--tRNA ligase [Neglecta sp. X4]|uniref:glycine--tRNA ligase n=1 Tax=unclassified Neglectibacter TaxID=2632164 RepID=UPI0013706F5F|nr:MULTISPECIES: glycine--tRNA ligase [unclassified Neglectibacter]NBI18878.1 glycine--tRNA ligase [Neglectibacter sp. 59]NBJ74574.1 glycine--tRNA ligase [Neglectibacter sp. X4]NCE82390.1 glycine--tRNA ligase [Neglectibacter sp. X58]
MKAAEKTMDMITGLCKNRGFIFPGSEIYGGLANTWDYGPLGTRLKNNVKDAWRKRFIQERENSFEIDADILMHPRVWEASGHVQSFSDPLLDCKECKMRHRADNLIDDFDPEAHADGMTKEEMFQYIKDHSIPCPHCGKHNFTDIREFNLMFQTYRGVTESSKSVIYLRPENAQGEYVNFLNVQRTMRAKLPFSIGQIGKAFRNEITPGNFTFRTIEFEQMEFQTFCKEGTDGELYEHFKAYGKKFFEDLGLPADCLRFHDHEKLAHYAKAACDIEYLFPFGWGEINGTHNRTDFDLSRHQEYSGQKMDYLDPETNEKFIPYIIESTYGLDRTVLALLCEAYDVEMLDEVKNDSRVVLHLHPAMAPYKAAVLPLSKKLSGPAREIYQELSKSFMVDFDETGSIGKRYRREDEIGTPLCITVDFDTVGDSEKAGDNCVTVRDRDTMEQERIPVSALKAYIEARIQF